MISCVFAAMAVGCANAARMASFTSVFQPKLLYGEWIIWHSTSPFLPYNNRVVVHIYPNEALTVSHRFSWGPLIYLREKVGSYTILEGTSGSGHRIDIRLKSLPDRVISCMGIEFGFLGVEGKTDRRKDLMGRFDVHMSRGCEDLFLSSSKNVGFHLVRYIRVNEPGKADVPLGTFVMSQVLGSLIAHLFMEGGDLLLHLLQK